MPRLARVPALAAGIALTLAAMTGCTTATGSDSRPAASAPEPPAGSVWVANEGGDTLTVIDAATGEVRTTLFQLAGPHNVQASATRDVVWVTVAGGVVGLDAQRLYPTEAQPAGDHPAHVVESSAGDVYVTAAGDGVLHGFDNTLRDPSQVKVGGAPHGMRLAPDGKTAVIANTAAGTVDVVDLAAGRKVAAVPVGGSPIQVAVSADGSTAYAAVAGPKQVVRVDLETKAMTAKVSLDSAPAQIWLTRSGLLLSANQGTEADPGSTVSIIDAATMTVRGTVPTGSGPHGITMNPQETHAWVTNSFDDTVTVIDLAQEAAVQTVPVGDYPNGITFTPVIPDQEPAPMTPLVLPHGYSHGSAAEGGHDHSEGGSSAPAGGHDSHDH